MPVPQRRFRARTRSRGSSYVGGGRGYHVGMANAKAATVAVFFLLLLAAPAPAWSTKEHILLTRLAALRLLERADVPVEMKAWLRSAAPNLPDLDGDREFLLHARIGVFPRGADGIPFWAVVPDLDALMDSAGPGRSKGV